MSRFWTPRPKSIVLGARSATVDRKPRRRPSKSGRGLNQWDCSSTASGATNGMTRKATGGRFERDASKFRNWVTPDGAPGPSGRGGFKAEPGRYHLYGAYFCPWAHRTLIFRELKGLAPTIDVSIVNWLMRENGLTFAPADGVIGDPLYGARFLYEIYRAPPTRITPAASRCRCSGTRRATTIVSTNPPRSSACSIRPSTASARRRAIFIRRSARRDRRAQRADLSDRSTMASTAPASPRRRTPMRRLSGRCSRRWIFSMRGWRKRRYLCGDRLTEADVRLLTTLAALRHCLCRPFQVQCQAHRRLSEPLAMCATFIRPDRSPRLSGPITSRGTIIKAICRSIRRGIVPVGPAIDFPAPHDRARLGRRAYMVSSSTGPRICRASLDLRRIAPGVGRESQQQRFVGGQKIEHAREKSGLGGGRAQIRRESSPEGS